MGVGGGMGYGSGWDILSLGWGWKSKKFVADAMVLDVVSGDPMQGCVRGRR